MIPFNIWHNSKLIDFLVNYPNRAEVNNARVDFHFLQLLLGPLVSPEGDQSHSFPARKLNNKHKQVCF